MPVPAPGAAPTPLPSEVVEGNALPCDVCGRMPTLGLRFRSIVGLILLAHKTSLEGNYCRDHGLALAKQYQLRTLFLGWWGITAFFWNLGAIAVNRASRKAARRLRPPA